MTHEVRQKMNRLIAKYKLEGKSERWLLAWKRGFMMADKVKK